MSLTFNAASVSRYFPHTEEDVKAMLQVIDAPTLEALYAEVPEQLKLKGELNLPSSMSEIEVRQVFAEAASKNKQLVCFAGNGAYDHYTPSVIPYITARSEFSTSYTPYQAEISQGTLQYIFEYQSLMADLTGMEVSNASMYDGTTATAEAMMMCVAAAKKRSKVLVSQTVPARVKDVMKTYAHFHGIELVTVPQTADGVTDKTILADLLAQNDAAGVVVAQPNCYGLIEDLTGVADECHAHKSLLVINAQASPLGVLKSPGEWGADIACGDAQSLGIPLSMGGPYIGYLCTTKALVRKMPGRLVGATTDVDGKRAFVLTLQAREQHIRREKATSNICTAQGMMCLYVASYLALMGKDGLREVNEQSYAGAHYLHDALLKTGKFQEMYHGEFLNEFTLRYNGDADALINACAAEGYLAGVHLGNGDILFAVTEQRTKTQADKLCELVSQ